MSKTSSSKKLIAYLLIAVTLLLTFSTFFLGSQMIEAQDKVSDLQSQIAQYKNTTDSLQTQANSLEAQVKDLQNPIDNVTLTVDSMGNWYGDPLTGYPYYKFINITLQNFGTRSIGGMTLDFKVEGNTTDIGYYEIHVDTNQGVLHVQESRSLRIQLIAPDIERTRELEDCKLVITLLLSEKVLDMKTVTIGD